MANTNEIIRLLRQVSGLKLDTSVDFEVLAQSILDKTGEALGANTLRRFFGYNTKQTQPRRSTLDILAQYLGFDDFASLELAIGPDADISSFRPNDFVDVAKLNKGDRIVIEYAPNRRLTLTYTGDFKFRIEEAEGSRNLLPDDILTIGQFAIGHRLVATEVERAGKNLGPYEAAMEGGLKRIEVSEGNNN